MGIGLTQTTFAGEPADPFEKEFETQLKIELTPQEQEEWKTIYAKFKDDNNPETKKMREKITKIWPKGFDDAVEEFESRIDSKIGSVDYYTLFYSFIPAIGNLNDENAGRNIADFFIARADKQLIERSSRKEERQKLYIDRLSDESKNRRLFFWNLNKAFQRSYKIAQNAVEKSRAGMPLFYEITKKTNPDKKSLTSEIGDLTLEAPSYEKLSDIDKEKWNKYWCITQINKIYKDPNQSFIALVSNYGEHANDYAFLDGLLFSLVTSVYPKYADWKPKYDQLIKMYRGWVSFASPQMGDDITKQKATMRYITGLLGKNYTKQDLDKSFGGKDMAQKYMPLVIDQVAKNYMLYKKEIDETFKRGFDEALTSLGGACASSWEFAITIIGIVVPLVCHGVWLFNKLFWSPTKYKSADALKADLMKSYNKIMAQ